MNKLFLIWNPVAGNGDAARAFAEAEAYLAARGVAYDAARTEGPGHASQLAQRALTSDYRAVVAVGGDGTVREVATSLFRTDMPMGILPSGSGNDLARPLGIPTNVPKALDIVLAGHTRRMDAAMCNDELFFNIAGFGFDVDVLDYVEIYKRKMKNGSLAYMRGLVAAISKLLLRKTTVRWPGGEMTKNVLLIAAGNGTHFGGGMKVTPRADPFDGLLDFCVIHDVNKRNIVPLMLRFRKGEHVDLTQYVTYFRAEELTAECEPASRLDIDGDVLPGTPVRFKTLPRSLSILVPEEKLAPEGPAAH